MQTADELLGVSSLFAHYGGLTAVHGVSLSVTQGEIVALVGCNSAGKTSTLRAISGTIQCTGEIRFNGLRLEDLAPYRRIDEGLVHVPEGRQLFQSMSVLENLELGAYNRRARKRRARNLRRAFEMFPRLYERRTQTAGSMSGGEQQMCSIARGLMAEPRLLMLDEPTLGLAPVIARDVLEHVLRIRSEGVTVLLVEQNVVHTLRMTDRSYVLENGHLVAHGRGTELLDGGQLKQAYLGVS